MLEMDRERVGFAEALRPPEDYELSFAVGTTYSLDLRALLGLCIPLGLGFEPESLQSINPVSLFAALTGLQNKLAVYCDKGSIKADIPGSVATSGLLMLLEGMIHQVHVNHLRKDELSSFHPKVWVIEYAPKHGGEKQYRLMVMSRNLTLDTSWDAVVVLEGRAGEPNACSEHLSQFLEFLAVGDRQTTTEQDDLRRSDSHAARVRKLAQDIKRVEFDVGIRPFNFVDFLPLGPQVQGQGPLLDANQCELLSGHHRNLLVVSPFLGSGDSSPLGRMANNRSGETGKFVLISREDSLSALNPELREKYDECFCPAPSLSDVELDSEGEANASDYSNLHAKIYFTESPTSRRTLYIGSLNASYNGTANNVEALLQLGVSPRYLTFSEVLKPLVEGEGAKKPPFSPYVAMDEGTPEDDGKKAFKAAFRIASRLLSFEGAKVVMNDDGTATIDVSLNVRSANEKCGDISLSLRPLFLANTQPVPLASTNQRHCLSFGGFAPEQVSALFFIEGRDSGGNEDKCIAVCPHDRFDDSELSLEMRSSAILSKLISHDNDALSNYIAHAFDLPEAAFSSGEGRKASTAASSKAIEIPHGLYERLLYMADVSPEVFQKAKYLMSLIPQDVQGEQLDELRKLLDTFLKGVK